MTKREEFEQWLQREMPAGTVISDPLWWAPRILSAARATAPEGMALVPAKASTEITFEIRGEKIVFCKDGVYFALTKSQIPAMHAAMLAAAKEQS